MIQWFINWNHHLTFSDTNIHSSWQQDLFVKWNSKKYSILPPRFVSGQLADLRSISPSHLGHLRSPVFWGSRPWSCSWSSPCRRSCPSRRSTPALAVTLWCWWQRPAGSSKRPAKGRNVTMQISQSWWPMSYQKDENCVENGPHYDC